MKKSESDRADLVKLPSSQLQEEPQVNMYFQKAHCEGME